MAIQRITNPDAQHEEFMLENGAIFDGYPHPEYVPISRYHEGNFSSVGFINDSFTVKGNTYRICVYSEDGPIPHFHVLDESGSGKEVCFYIFEPRYYDHGDHGDGFDKEEIEALDSFLGSLFCDRPRWIYIVSVWGTANPDNYRDYRKYWLTTSKPDYSSIL